MTSGSRPTALVVDGADGHALTCVRSLGRAGWRVVTPAASRLERSRYSAVSADVPSASQDRRGYLDGVRRAVDEHDVDVLVPCDDRSLEVWHRDGDPELRVVGAAPSVLERMLDKREMLRVVEAAGFPVPRWHAPSDVAEARAAIADIGVPLVLKHRRSFAEEQHARAGLRRHAIPRTPGDALRTWSAMAAGGEPPLIQQFVEGRPHAVAAVVSGGRRVVAVARETFTYLPVRGGNSVWLATVGPGAPGVAEALALLDAVGFEGTGDVQYVVEPDGTPRLMEIGARVNAWVDLAILAGVDLPVVGAQAALGGAPVGSDRWEAGVERRAPLSEIARIREALRAPGDLPPGTSRGDVLRGLWPPWRPGMHYKNVDVRDLRPLMPQLRRA